jgi:hypothetical protein
MGSLRHEEVRRLLKHLRGRVDSDERLAEIEDELPSEFAKEFLREPDLLIYFPELSEEFVADGALWRLRFIPHAHLRMVQRGLKQSDLTALFRRFVETYAASGQVITAGPYNIWGRLKPGAPTATLRADVDVVNDENNQAHVVTVFLGRSDTEGSTDIGPV